LKNSFSLIELIFTIVIIGFIFTTIPKIIYTTNQSFKAILKEDGLFNMITKIMDITFNEWDENDTISYDILLTGNNNILECKSSQNPPIRVGGFYSGDLYSRLCKRSFKISHIGPDALENSQEDYDDIDDYNNSQVDAIKNGSNRYTLYITNGYSDEWSDSNYNYDTQTLTFQFTNNQSSKSNIKLTKITLHDNKFDKNISNARYWSANIGKIRQIESEQW
jgi:hypothetical protein